MKIEEVNIDDIKDDILSPGRIVWIQRSGSEVVISAKGSFLNLEMIAKLQKGGHKVIIQNDDETAVHAEFADVYRAFSEGEQIKHKLKHRNEFLGLLFKNYINSNRTQDDLNQLAWKLFSQLSREEARSYLNRDINFFKRGMSVASSYVFCAFLMGHYDTQFLNNLFTTTMRNLMQLGTEQLIGVLKNKLEIIRQQPHLSEGGHQFIKTISDKENFQQRFMLEKFDGSGVLGIKTEDMNDLELILSSLNYYFQWTVDYEGKNILAEIYDGRFKINAKVLSLIKTNLVAFRTGTQAVA